METKNIIIIVADSLRRDTYHEISNQRSLEVKSCNSCTELSLPWMISGMELFSPNMNIPKDLEKLGYHTYLIHSNAVINKFKQPFQYTFDISQGNKKEQLTRKYSRIRNTLQKHIPTIIYNLIKKAIRGYPETYLPQARITKNLITLREIEPTEPYFLWLHLMDPHTPYYPQTSLLPIHKIIDYNDNQICAVRGYYKPKPDETKTWYSLYRRESREMWLILELYLRSLDLEKNTVIFTSDHGEEFGEYGEYGHKGNRFNSENVDVPFLVYGENLPNPAIKDHSQLREYVKRLTK